MGLCDSYNYGMIFGVGARKRRKVLPQLDKNDDGYVEYERVKSQGSDGLVSVL